MTMRDREAHDMSLYYSNTKIQPMEATTLWARLLQKQIACGSNRKQKIENKFNGELNSTRERQRERERERAQKLNFKKYYSVCTSYVFREHFYISPNGLTEVRCTSMLTRASDTNYEILTPQQTSCYLASGYCLIQLTGSPAHWLTDPAHPSGCQSGSG